GHVGVGDRGRGAGADQAGAVVVVRLDGDGVDDAAAGGVARRDAHRGRVLPGLAEVQLAVVVGVADVVGSVPLPGGACPEHRGRREVVARTRRAVVVDEAGDGQRVE